MIFRQLQSSVDFDWATRIIVFTQVNALIVSVFEMRERISSTTLRRLLNWQLFKKWSFLLILFDMLFEYMSIYISFFYIELYALTRCRASYNFASYILTIINVDSLFERLMSTYFADRYLKSVNLHTALAFADAFLIFAWISIKSTADIIAFDVIYDFISNEFVSLEESVIFSLTNDLQIMRTCLDMITEACDLDLLLNNSIADFILNRESWTELQMWNDTLLFVADIILLKSRVERYEMTIEKKV